jgi:hypothetical protein
MFASYHQLKESDFNFFIEFEHLKTFITSRKTGKRYELTEDEEYNISHWCMHSVGGNRYVYEMIDRDFDGIDDCKRIKIIK